MNCTNKIICSNIIILIICSCTNDSPISNNEGTYYGIYNSTAPKNISESIWKQCVSDNINFYWSPPLVIKDNVIACSREATYIFNKKTGTLIKQLKYDINNFSGVSSAPTTPVLYGSKLILAVGNKVLEYESILDSIPKWEFGDRYSTYFTFQVLYKDKLFVSSNQGVIYCINPNDGNLLWQNEYAKNDIIRGFAINEDILIFGSVDHNTYESKDKLIYGLNINTGKKVWQFISSSGVNSIPTVSDNLVFIQNNNSYLYCLYSKTGIEKWRHKIDLTIESMYHPTVYNEIVYIVAIKKEDEKDGNVNWAIYAINIQNGSTVWSRSIGSGHTSIPISISKNNLLFVSEWFDGIFCLNPKTGNTIFNYKESKPTSEIVISDKYLFYFESDGGYGSVLTALK